MGSQRMTRFGGDLPSSSKRPPTRPVMRPIAIRPFPRGSVSFTPWHPSWENSLGFSFAFAGSSSNINNANNKPNRQLLDLNFPPVEDHNSNMVNNDVNRTPNIAMRNPGGGVSANEALAVQPIINDQTKEEMDSRKLNQLLLNRNDAKRSKMRKEAEVDRLERRLKSLKNEISTLCQQIEVHNDRPSSVMFENHKYKLSEVNSERNELLQEVGRERSRLHLYRSNECQAEQQVQEQARKMSIGASIQIRPRLHCTFSNSNQVQNGVGTSRIQFGMGQQTQNGEGTSRLQLGISPQIQNGGTLRIQLGKGQQRHNQNQVLMANQGQQDQSQVWMANQGIGQRSTLNYWSIMKTESRDN